MIDILYENDSYFSHPKFYAIEKDNFLYSRLLSFKLRHCVSSSQCRGLQISQEKGKIFNPLRVDNTSQVY